MTKPEDRGLSWGDVELLVAAAEKSKKDPEVVVAARAGVDAKTARAWVAKVRSS